MLMNFQEPGGLLILHQLVLIAHPFLGNNTCIGTCLDLFSADGIMGLGRGQLSIMDQLVEKGVISDSFSLCYGGMDIGGGAMVLGGVPAPSDMVFSHSDPLRR